MTLKSSFAGFSLLLLAASVCLTGCHGAGGSGVAQVAVVPQNLIGSWEVVSISENGRTGPATMTSPANEAGYTDSAGKLQYQISATKFKVISSDELAVVFTMEEDYALNGKNLVPKNSANESMAGFQIVSLTGSTLTIKPGVSQPPDIQFNLVRITESQLATNKLKPIPEKVSYIVQAPLLNVTESMTSVFPTDYSAGNSIAIDCIYRKGKSPNLQVDTNAFTVSPDGSVSMGGDNSSVGFAADVKFDWSKKSEEIKFNLGPAGSAATLQGLYSENSVKAQFAVGSNGGCAVDIKRVKRLLNISSTCTGVDFTAIAGPLATAGALTLSEQCVLQF